MNKIIIHITFTTVDRITLFNTIKTTPPFLKLSIYLYLFALRWTRHLGLLSVA